MISLATSLPENSNDGYVAAAYIAFFAIVLIYVAIMAIRLSRVERAVRELRRSMPESAGGRREPEEGAPRARVGASAEKGATRDDGTLGRSQERETV